MRIFKSCLVFVVIVFLGFSCSKKDQASSKKRKKVKAVPPIVQLDVVPEKPVSSKDIEVFAVMTDEARKKDISLLVEWKLNGDILEDENELFLVKEKFVKGDVAQCTVMASLNGRHLQTLKTPKLKVANSPPEIHPKIPGGFEIPGTFYHKIKASDPDEDELRYTLLSPLDRGIRLNETTGEIEWYISYQLLDKLEEDAGLLLPADKKRETDQEALDPERRNIRNVKVEFMVTDSDNASDTGFIMLNVATGKEADPI